MTSPFLTVACLGPCTPGLQNEFPEPAAEPESCLSKGQLGSLRLKSEIPISFWFLSLCIKFQKRENSHWLSILHMVTFEMRNSHLFLILKPLYHISEERRSQWLSVLHILHMANKHGRFHVDSPCTSCPLLPSPPFPPLCIHESVLSVCISIAALQIGSTEPSF